MVGIPETVGFLKYHCVAKLKIASDLTTASVIVAVLVSSISMSGKTPPPS